MSEPLNRLLERNAQKYPGELAVRYPAGEVSLTWGEVNEQANALARHLAGSGIGPGDKVALLIPNCPEFVAAFFAILKLAAVAVPINVRLTPSEISFILDHSDSAGLIYYEPLQEAAQQAAARAPKLRFSLSTARLADITHEQATGDLDTEISLLDDAEIIYTSGTTGRPKGVVLTHNAVYAVGAMIAYEADIRRGDRVLHLMPFSHSAPLNLFLCGAAYAGAANIVADFSPQALLQLTDAEQVTHFFGAPIAFLAATRLPDFDRYDLSSVRRWIYGGAPMAREAVLLVA